MPPGGNTLRRGTFWATPSPSSFIAAVTAAIPSSISMSSWTSASRRIRATAGRIARMTQAPLNVGLIGLGTVGAQVAERMLTWRPQLSRRAGVELCLQKVLVRDLKKPRAVEMASELLTTDPSELLDDPAIQVLVEVAGGDEPMRGYLERAIRAGKHVVTANKVVMAKHGPELLDLAAEKNVDVYFEAAVGGGIPLISTFRTDLQANTIKQVSAVINGTTNYVLGRMAAAGLSLAEAVAEAQAAGFAEADPTDDVGGFDAAYKLAILGSIAYEIKVRPDEIYREGIEGVEAVDFRYARELGYAIKLIAHTQRHAGRASRAPRDGPARPPARASRRRRERGLCRGRPRRPGAAGRTGCGRQAHGVRCRRRPHRPREVHPARRAEPPVIQLRRPDHRGADGRGRDTHVLPDSRRRQARRAGGDRPGLCRRGRQHLELHSKGRVVAGPARRAGRHDPSVV